MGFINIFIEGNNVTFSLTGRYGLLAGQLLASAEVVLPLTIDGLFFFCFFSSCPYFSFSSIIYLSVMIIAKIIIQGRIIAHHQEKKILHTGDNSTSQSMDFCSLSDNISRPNRRPLELYIKNYI